LTIYVDIIFLENIFMNCIILFATGIILKTKIKIIRLMCSSIIGSTYAVISYISALEIYSNFLLKIILSLIMVYIAFNPSRIKSFLKYIMIFYLTSFTFGGVAFALLYFISPQNIFFENGVLIGTSPIKIILAGGIVGFIIITVSFKNIKGKLTKKDMICNITIFFNNKQETIKVIIDTGNFLTDPITKIPVIVVEKDKLVNLLPKKLLINTSKFIKGEDIEIGEYISKMRIIPFNSLGKEHGLLLGVKIDRVIINYQDTDKKVDEVIVGIYEGKLSKNNAYSGLIGLNILEKGEDLIEYTRYIKS